ncbi:hypothetical protein ACQPZP_34280 [Spirillospora sp. CA-142024]|uniref:hypothetical protein n=1 Tax=Spirillospora sp. CA-142024 TaxID=3240036 RepID=UPI003D8EE2B9
MIMNQRHISRTFLPKVLSAPAAVVGEQLVHMGAGDGAVAWRACGGLAAGRLSGRSGLQHPAVDVTNRNR